VRATTAFKRILGLPGVRVRSVELKSDEVVVGIELSSSRLRCRCGYLTRSSYDRRRRRWRHLDVGGWRCLIEANLRRLECPTCGVRTEVVPFARPGARHTRAFEALVVWAASHLDKTAAAELCRVAWETVDAIVARVVDESLSESRFSGLRRIGVDERSWRRRRAMTVVVDHDSGRVVWVGQGARSDTLGKFFDEIGPTATAEIEVVTMDMGRAYKGAVQALDPTPVICFDPFHVMALANRALDALRRRIAASLRLEPRSQRVLRWALLGSGKGLNPARLAALDTLRADRHVLWRAWVLKEELADLYRLADPSDARAYLRRWLGRAARSRIPVIVNLARTIRANFDGIVAAVELDLSNSRLEGFNSKVALINHRGYGFHSPESLKAMIYLTCGPVPLPRLWPLSQASNSNSAA
jgi:transposase